MGYFFIYNLFRYLSTLVIPCLWHFNSSPKKTKQVHATTPQYNEFGHEPLLKKPTQTTMGYNLMGYNESGHADNTINLDMTRLCPIVVQVSFFFWDRGSGSLSLVITNSHVESCAFSPFIFFFRISIYKTCFTQYTGEMFNSDGVGMQAQTCSSVCVLRCQIRP